MNKLESMIGKRIEARILQGAPFDFVISEVDNNHVSGHDDNGETWQIRRDAIIMWHEKPIKARATKK